MRRQRQRWGDGPRDAQDGTPGARRSLGPTVPRTCLQEERPLTPRSRAPGRRAGVSYYSPSSGALCWGPQETHTRAGVWGNWARCLLKPKTVTGRLRSGHDPHASSGRNLWPWMPHPVRTCQGDLPLSQP